MTLRRKLGGFSAAIGFNPLTTMNYFRGLPYYLRESANFRKKFASSESAKSFVLRRSVSFSGDRFAEAGSIRGHYFTQDLFVARRIFETKPERHIDVGSRIDGFVAHVAAFREIDVLDVRYLEVADSNLHFHQVDLMNLEPRWFESTDSLSCLHALEHFGLGRYGDPIDPDGWLKGLSSLHKILKPGGTLYLSVPTGITQRVEFNSQRVFSLEHLTPVLTKLFIVQKVTHLSSAGQLTPLQLEGRYTFKRHDASEFDCSIWELERPGVNAP